MVKRTRSQFQNVVVAAVIIATVALLAPGPSTANHQTVTAVQGSAYGYRAFNLTLFGGPQPEIPATPAVTLASDASNSPQMAQVTTSFVQVAETATILTTDAINVSTAGSLGPNGSVTSNASLTNVGRAATQPLETGGEVLDAARLASTCTASESVLSGSTTVTGGRIRTDSGFDANDDGDLNDVGDLPEVFATLPTTPTVNQTFTGIVRFSTTSSDTFTLILNEQVQGPGRTITVNAAHLLFGTPGTRLRGDLILGQVVCGVTLLDLPPTTAAPETTTTTVVSPTTTTTVVSPTTTTTVVSPTTSTTVAAGTTTLAPGPNIPTLIRQILCPILQRFAAIPFFRPFILRFLVLFGCQIP